ncbi:alpha/beta fold hydrolase [Chloroflexota bacterium]
MPYADNNGIRIYYQVEGDGTPLLLHHPLTGSHRVWYRNGFVDALKGSYKVITMDMRGHGRSDKPHEQTAYGWDIRVTDIAAVLNDAGADKVHMIGYSAGGFGGFAMARYAPDRLLSLVIGAAQPYGEDTYPIGKNGVDTETLLNNFAIAAGEPLHHSLKSATQKKDMTPIAYILAQGVPSWEDVLPTIKVPCLLFSGEHDVRYERMKKCADVISNATFIPMPGLGHLDGFTHIDVMLPHILKFLEAHNAKA